MEFFNKMDIRKPDKNPWLIRIYKITSTALNSDWCYVGQTKSSLEKRWDKHQEEFRKWVRTDKRSGKIAWFEKAIELNDLDLKTFKTELLEEAQVSSKKEVKLLEGKWMRLLKSCNKYTPKENQPDDPDIVRIYKIITSLDDSFCYVGQTVRTLKNRWSTHKSCFKNWIKNDRITRKCAWFEKAVELEDLDLKTFKIELLEESTFMTDEDKDALERKWMDALDCCNINKPGRTNQEYYQDNWEKYKKYREDNKQKILERMKKYTKENKQIIREKQKKYQEKNKDKILEYQKKYQEQNKEKISEQRNQKNNCACGGTYTNRHVSTHIKSKKHQEFLKKNTATDSSKV